MQVPLTDEDIRIITSAMRTANRILHESSGGGHAQFWSGSFSTGGAVEDFSSHHLGAFLNEEFNGLDGRLSSAFDELERLFRPQAADREGWEGEPRSRPDLESLEEAQTVPPSLQPWHAHTRASLKKLCLPGLRSKDIADSVATTSLLTLLVDICQCLTVRSCSTAG